MESLCKLCHSQAPDGIPRAGARSSEEYWTFHTGKCMENSSWRKYQVINYLITSQGAYGMGGNKGMKRINSLPLSSFVISYTDLQGKPLPTLPIFKP